MLASDFAALPDLIRAHARERGDKPALLFGDRIVTYAELDRTMDRIAFSLQCDGVKQGQAVAILGPNSLEYGLAFLGALRAGCVAAPLAPSATPEQLAAMVADCGAPILFHDAAHDIPVPVRKVALERLDDWLGDGVPAPATVTPDDPFNIIYSSGTTGTPKGIVQPHAMRWVAYQPRPSGLRRSGDDGRHAALFEHHFGQLPAHARLGRHRGADGEVRRARISDARRKAPRQRHHARARPVSADHGRSRFRPIRSLQLPLKTCTSAPFSAALKADVLARWPGLLVEYYGMTEGGGTTILICNAHPDKLHTVGKPLDGHDIRLIDDEGREVAQGEMGEVVGRSPRDDDRLSRPQRRHRRRDLA
jgi:acyl-CoA synthetase (AMP-forming)/AMP-acid ligase II